MTVAEGMRVIGLTGGIGAGKSHVSRILTDTFCIPVFNCDIEARRLTLIDPDIRSRLTALLGAGLYRADGTIDKALLADYMFVQGHADRVNAVIHPAVRRWFAEWRGIMAGEDIVAIESAILVESGFHDLCDEIWLVSAPLELRIRRAMQRDRATRRQIEARINAQTTDDERKKHASHVIINDGTGDILAQIKSLIIAAKPRETRAAGA